MDLDYSLTGVIKTLYRWRKPVLYLTAAAAILSIVLSLLMPNYYEGKTVFYAASQDLFKPEKVFGGSNSDMYYYGSEEDMDRIMTIGTSKELIDLIVDSFDLYRHYKLDRDKPLAGFKVREKFLDAYGIMRTKYDAMELTFEDKDPVLAAAIANTARNKINAFASGIIKGSQMNIISSYRQAVENKQGSFDQLSDSLSYYRRKYGIYDPDGQTEQLSGRVTDIEMGLYGEKAKLGSLRKIRSPNSKIRDSIDIIEARIVGFESELANLNSDTSSSKYNLKNFNESKGTIELLGEQYERAVSQLTADKERIKYFQSALDLKSNAIHVVEEAEVPIKKSKPRRSIIVMVSTILAFIIGVIAVLLIEGYREVPWREILSDDEVANPEVAPKK